MKKLLLPALLLAAVFLLASYRLMHGKQPGANTGFAVVELYTSEGCSSCPPADEAVANLLQQGNENVYVLGFHVDYWNYLGWKDAFSDAGYSARQQQYGKVFALGSVYTPQAVVNGQTEFTGSDTRKLHDVIERALSQPAAASLQISAIGMGQTVNVNYKTNGAAGGALNVALVQLHAQSSVKRGENSGRVLNHVNVVRAFKTIDITPAAQGSVSINIPAGLALTECSIIAFTQDGGWKVTSAAETAIK